MDSKTLSIEGIVSNSSELNKVSTELNDICTGLYSTITSLRDAGHFLSVTASETYFESIDNLNQMVPKFTEAILRFSRFLSDYVLQNYTEVDEEIHSKIESNLAESLAGLTSLGVISATGIDYGKIASTAQGALNGDFISSDKIYRKSFEQEGSLDFVTRDDGSIVITKDGVPIGFTTKEGIQNTSSFAGESTPPDRHIMPVDQGTGQIRADLYDNKISSNMTQSTSGDTAHVPREVQNMISSAKQQSPSEAIARVPREVQNMVSESEISSVAATVGTGEGATNVNLNQLDPEISSNMDNLLERLNTPSNAQADPKSLLDQFSLKPSNQPNLDSLLSDFDLNIKSENK